MMDHRRPTRQAGRVTSSSRAPIQIAQHADDLARATRWYADLLGRQPAATYDPPGLVFFDVGGVRLMLEGATTGSMIYLPVDDIDATVERLRGSGVEIDTEPHVIFSHEDDTLGPAGTDEWQAFVRDSEGNLVGLVEQRPTA
jgi:methylmalonyl-CoA/ethylmalonyl-CoA epimerase